MNDKPWVGEVVDEYRAVCLYSPTPADPICGAEAVVHVMVEHDGGLGGLPACAEHAPIARIAGSFLAEHPFGIVCCLPGVVWLPEENICVIDDRGVEPTLAGQVGADAEVAA